MIGQIICFAGGPEVELVSKKELNMNNGQEVYVSKKGYEDIFRTLTLHMSVLILISIVDPKV